MNTFISAEIERCISDMESVVRTGKMSLDAQVRAYDLLEYILDVPPGHMPSDSSEHFLSAFADLDEGLSKSYDEDSLRAQSDDELAPFRKELGEAETNVGRARQLHECAKETYDIWMNAGFFARQKALRILRQKAGFRLESKRIGNYVAKTFDHMNEAAAAYARAQQTLFAADRSYKIRPGIYGEIAAALKSNLP